MRIKFFVATLGGLLIGLGVSQAIVPQAAHSQEG